MLCCGNIAIDLLARPVVEPGWGRTTWLDELEQSVGGNGANTSYALAKLGVPARLMSAVGSDAFGNSALATLREAGVDTEPVARVEAPTPATVVLVNPDGHRALLHRPGASRMAFSNGVQLGPELWDGCERFHLANPFALPLLQPHAPDLLAQARSAGLSTSLDTGWDAQGLWMRTLGPCLPFVQLLFVNEDEARELTGEADGWRAARQLQVAGAQTVVVKRAAKGCLVLGDGLQFESPGFNISAIDSTGAGDCFAGGFLAALSLGSDYAGAARLANAVGALSAQALGSIAGLKSYSDTLSWLELQTA